MRFRFCGDLDCPDWLLAEVARMSQASVRDMQAVVEEVFRCVLAGTIDQKASLAALREKLKSFNLSDLEGMAAGVHFIATSSAKNNVDDVSLLQEIQQLGLSRESAELICAPYRTSKEAVQQQLELTSFRLNHLQSVDWRVDQILASSNTEQPLDKVAVIKLGLSDGDSVFEISKERLDVLIQELKQARGILKR